MRKILIAGYYGFGNAGDELILRAVSRELRRGTDAGEIRVLSGDPGRTREEHGLEAVDRWSPWRVFRSLLWCDVLLFGGGGLLQDVTGSAGLWYYLFLLRLALFLNRRVCVYAAGVGPLRRGWNRRAAGGILRRADWVTARDGASLYILRGMGVARAVLQPDPVFSLDIRPVPPAPAAGRRVRLGIVPRDYPGGRERCRSLARAALDLSRRMGAEIDLIAFHPEHDQAVMDEMQSLLAGGARRRSWRNLDELIAILAGMDMVVSMRLHALIVAALLGRPFFGIAVDPKLTAFLARFGSAGLPPLWAAPEECDPKRIAGGTAAVWEKRGILVRRMETVLAEFKSETPSFSLREMCA